MPEEPNPPEDRKALLHTVGMRLALEMRRMRLTSDEMRDVLATQAIAWAGMSMEDIPRMKANLVLFVERIEKLFTSLSAVGVERLRTMRQALMDRISQDHLGQPDGSFEGVLAGWTSPLEGPIQVIVRLDDGDEILIDPKAIDKPDAWYALHYGKRIRGDYRKEGNASEVVRVTELS